MQHASATSRGSSDSSRSSNSNNATDAATTGGAAAASYTDEQHLLAAIVRLRKLEGENQSALEHMYTALQSPFKITTRRCDARRADVLRCYERLRQRQQQQPSSSSSSTPPLLLSADDVLQMPLHTCCDAVAQYERCVDEEVRGVHVALARKMQQGE